MGTIGRWILGLVAGGIAFLVVTTVVSSIAQIGNWSAVIGLVAGAVVTGMVAGARSLGQWALAAFLLVAAIGAILGVLLLSVGGCPICPT